MPVRKKILNALNVNTDSHSHKLFQTVFTVFLAVLAWVFFRADSLGTAVNYIGGMFSCQSGPIFGIADLGFDSAEWTILFAGIIIIFLVGLVKYNMHLTIDGYLSKQNLWFRWLILFVLLFMIIIFGQYGPEYSAQAFIYFQF